MYSHIIRMAGNSAGDDFITTDPHGNLQVLQAVATTCLEGESKDGNRLFLCGDLMDRGPDSLAIIRYVNFLNEDLEPENKKIYAIRGNHEDSLLKALAFIEIVKLLEMKKPEDSLNYIVDEKSGLRLNQLAPHWWDIILNEGRQLRKLALSFSYQEAVKQEAYIDTHFSAFDARIDACINFRAGEHWGIIKNLFVYPINAIKNGADWVFRISAEERSEVKDFIQQLPYIIRVDAVELEDQKTAAFDIVHAAPLSEEDIQEILAMDNPVLNLPQIRYVTWARPVSLCGEHDIKMKLSYRSAGSIRAYVGHNVLSAHLNDYRDKNVFNLDADTYGSRAMFVVNHTKSILSVEPCNLQLSHYADVFKALWTLRDMLQPQAVTVEQKHRDIYAYTLVACQQKVSMKAVFENSEQLVLPEDVRSDGAKFGLFRKIFLDELERVVATMSPELCIALSRFLLQQDEHPLAREFNHFDKKRYSYQTHSMSTATGLLLKKGINACDDLVIVKPSCFSTKVTFFLKQSGVTNEVVYVFSRHRKLF